MRAAGCGMRAASGNRQPLVVLLAMAGLALAAPAFAQAPVSSTCVDCHSYAVRRSFLEISDQWEHSIHAAKGVDCSGCHGGDPADRTVDGSMSRQKGFVARWSKQQIPAMCARCHADPARMRPFNLPTSQFAQYQQSVHGRRLRQGDTNVAACTDCHGSHLVLSRDDPKSPVFKANIPSTCGRCHSDRALMKPYGIPTDQLTLYRGSVHGQKLLVEGDRGAPACADCHGTHGATPPGVKEVAQVCGSCHARTADNFNQGPHRVALGKSGHPRCIDCHGHHGIQFPTDAMLVSSRGCASCHQRGSQELALAEEVYQILIKADRTVNQAKLTLDRADAVGMDVADEAAKLDEARTSLTEARDLQHTVTLDKIRPKAEEADLTAGRAFQSGEAALIQRYRRNMTVLTVGIFCLLTAGLLLVKRRTLPPLE